jgi:hypothetical protein
MDTYDILLRKAIIEKEKYGKCIKSAHKYDSKSGSWIRCHNEHCAFNTSESKKSLPEKSFVLFKNPPTQTHREPTQFAVFLFNEALKKATKNKEKYKECLKNAHKVDTTTRHYSCCYAENCMLK